MLNYLMYCIRIKAQNDTIIIYTVQAKCIFHYKTKQFKSYSWFNMQAFDALEEVSVEWLNHTV